MLSASPCSWPTLNTHYCNNDYIYCEKSIGSCTVGHVLMNSSICKKPLYASEVISYDIICTVFLKSSQIYIFFWKCLHYL